MADWSFFSSKNMQSFVILLVSYVLGLATNASVPVGACGVNIGQCDQAAAPCCSKSGYCGSNVDYCRQPGCQAAFGSCWEYGVCGEKWGVGCKANSGDNCCSEWGYCGSTAAFCNAKTQWKWSNQ
jgi:hypothetical protein